MLVQRVFVLSTFDQNRLQVNCSTGKASAKIKKRVNEFADWLMNYVPPRAKATVSNSIQKILNLFPKK